MEQIAHEKAAIWNSNRTEEAEGPTRKLPQVRHSRPAKPHFVKPMKATAVDRLPEGDEWIYEIKWDGYRVIAMKHGDEVRLLSLKEKNLTSDFATVAEAINGIAADTAVIDGEVVAVNAQGCPSFQALQNRASAGRDWQILYYAFDLLNSEGRDWTRKPLRERKAKLRDIIAGSQVRYNAELEGRPMQSFMR
ncbi:MAG: hypothetical protein JO354_02565 [Verrucomicrobia bacterium]|nr:hypothetical protein [Verrucomicrobiota bacterium]